MVGELCETNIFPFVSTSMLKRAMNPQVHRSLVLRQVLGTGAEATAGSTVKVNYTGRLVNGPTPQRERGGGVGGGKGRWSFSSAKAQERGQGRLGF